MIGCIQLSVYSGQFVVGSVPKTTSSETLPYHCCVLHCFGMMGCIQLSVFSGQFVVGFKQYVSNLCGRQLTFITVEGNLRMNFNTRVGQ